MPPGIVVVWSGEQPRYDAIPIPATGLPLGRDQLDPGDIEISRHHVELTWAHGRLGVRDRGSRNGCLVDGVHVEPSQKLETSVPAVLRIGRTICLALPELEPAVSLTRRGRVVVARTLAATCAALDTAARAEEHVALIGPISLGRELALGYANTVGGDRIVVELDVMTALPMERSIDRARSPRTMVLVLDRPLTLPDLPELEAWLETDVRIVSVARCTDSFKYMPKEVLARLMPHVLELPQHRLDELAATVFDRVRARAPQAKIHASLIEVLLLHLPSTDEERLLRSLDHAITGWLERELASFNGRDFEDYLASDALMHHCIAGVLP